MVDRPGAGYSRSVNGLRHPYPVLAAFLMLSLAGSRAVPAAPVGAPAAPNRISPAPARVASQPPSAERVRRAIESVLARREFQHRGPSLKERLLQWIGDWLERLGLRLPQLNAGGRDINLLPVLVGIVAAAGFLYLVYYLALVSPRRIAEEVILPPGASVPESARSSDICLREADALAAHGDYRAALERAYVGTLLALNDRERLEFRPTRTNWENLQTLVPGLDGEIRRTLRRVSHLFDRKWYGLEAIGAEEYRRAARELAGVRDAA